MAVRPPTNPGMSRMPEDFFEKRLLWGMGASLCANFVAGIVVSSAIGRMKMPGERALPSLIEMARWKSPGHALSPFFLLGRIGNLSEEEIQKDWDSGNRETLIEMVLQKVKSK